MSEKNTDPTVTETDLQKSIESLMALLDDDASVGAVSDLEKSMAQLGTLGGLADKVGAPPLNPELTMGGAEQENLGEEDADPDHMVRQVAAQQMSATPMEKPMNKSEVAEQDELEGEDFVQDEEFAKSLAAAFADHEAVIDAASSSDFAKSLVLGTIEGLSIAHDEFSKSLSALESRNDEKIAVLAKGLAAIAKAVNEIRREVVAVSNAPVRPMAKSVRALEKSFGGQDQAMDPALLKSRVMATLERRVADGKLDAFQLVRYETSGVLDPALAKDIQSELGI